MSYLSLESINITIDRGGVGMGNVFQLVIIQHLYSVEKG